MADNKTLLITGCNGQVGQSLALLDWRGFNVVTVNRDSFDLSNLDHVQSQLDEINPDVVINAAAYTAVDLAESEQQLAHTVNAEATAVMAQVLARKNALLIHYSTDYVFRGDAKKPYVESDVTNPVSEYGKSKLAGEALIESSGCRYLIFRTSWVYSEFGKNFLLTMLRLASERSELRVVNDQFGCPTYAGDLAQLTRQIVQKLDVNQFDQSAIYHLGNDGITTWYDFTKAIMQYSEIDISIVPVKTDEFPTPAQRPLYSVLDKEKVKKDFSIKIPSWQDGLKHCLERV